MTLNLAVIGLGKLGLPMACLHADRGHRVYGIDFNPDTVAQINEKICPITEPDLPDLLAEVIESGNLTAHTDYSVVSKTDMSLIIVPTPSTESLQGAFDSGFVLDAVRKIGEAVKDQKHRHVVVVCSTVMPGQCAGAITDELQKASGKTVGDDIGLIYSPEFIALGTVITDMEYPNLILIGESDPESGKLYADVARLMACKRISMPPIRHMSLTSAEIAKISLNAYVTMKISFANSISELCERYETADAKKVCDAIGFDPRIGSQYIRPGGPYGGPCFPRDNRAFALAARHVGIDLPLAEAADEINERQVERVIRLIETFGRNEVGIVGMSYKNGTPVTEQSFGVNLGRSLQKRGYQTKVWSPFEIQHRSIVLPGTWKRDLAHCFGDDIVTVLALPEPTVVDRLSQILPQEGKRQSIIIDVWDCIPNGPWDATHVVRMGRHDDTY